MDEKHLPITRKTLTGESARGGHTEPSHRADPKTRLALILVVLGTVAALVGVGYLVWRWAAVSECAWVSPAADDWTEAGVRPSVAAECPLNAGSNVTDAQVEDVTVLLRGPGQVIRLMLEPSGPLVLTRLAQAASSLLFCAGFFGLALFAALRRPGERAAATTVVIAGALLGSTIVTMVGLPAHSAFVGYARWAFMVATQPLFLVAWGAMLAWLLLFPTPWRGVARPQLAWVAALVGPSAIWAAAAVVLAATASSFTGWMHAAIIVESSVTVTTLAVCLVILILRLRTGLRTAPGSVPRQQLIWVAGSAIVAGLLTFTFWMIPQLLTGQPLLPTELIGAPGLIFVAGFGIAILRYRMFDLDAVLARTLVYAGLTLAVVLVYLAATAVLAAGFGALAPAQVAVIAAVLAAVFVNPLRVTLQRWVNRTLYGARDDPYAALSKVAANVTDGGSADARVAREIRKALRVRYVGILRGDAGATAESGDPAALEIGALDSPVEYSGDRVGTLRVSLRGPGEHFSRGERRLLTDVARQIGAGLHEEGLARALQQSRERIIIAREEERRALRRALHDDVGPTMAAVSLRAEAVRRLLDRDGTSAQQVDAVLAGISDDASSAAESLRRLSYNLRPPALDQYGLEDALRRFAMTIEEPDVYLESDGEPEPLSAAVEAAAYRIAVAAVSNAERHSGARRCAIELSRSAETLEVVVADDGSGLPPDFTEGVGITSMRERAQELGGVCSVTSSAAGTVVRALIPIGGGT